MRAWQIKEDSADTGRFTHSIFPYVILRPLFEGPKEKRRFVCTVSRVLSGIVENLMCVCVCAGDYETVDFEKFRQERHRLIDALTALNVSIGIPIRDLCALKKWCALKCCLDFLEGFDIKL
jgi:hypothetical protein